MSSASRTERHPVAMPEPRCGRAAVTGETGVATSSGFAVVTPRAPLGCQSSQSRGDPAVHGGRERIAAGAVVEEHVHGGAARRQQHRVPGPGEPGGRVDHTLHRITSLVGAHIDDGHIGRVSRKSVGDDLAVATQEHDAPQPLADRDDEVVEARSLGQAAGDPDDRVVRAEGGLRGVRVGGLGVVDPGDAVALRDEGDAVAVGAEGAQPVAYGLLADAVGAGERRGGQGVGDEVGCRRGEVVEGAELGGAGGALLDEGPVHEQVLDDADVAGARHPEGEPDGPGALEHVGLAHHLLGGGVGQVVDARPLDPLEDPRLVGGVALHARQGPPRLVVVPVEVVLGDVEHRGRLRRHRVGVVELEAGELDGQHVVGLGVHHGLDDRQADVADRGSAEPGREQDRGQHLHGRGLAVGAGDRQPRSGVLGVAQPPGELDLPPDRDAAPGRLREERRGRLPPRRGDHEVDVGRAARRWRRPRGVRSRRGSPAARPSPPSPGWWPRRGR